MIASRLRNTLNTWPSWSDWAFAAGFVVVIGMLVWMMVLS